MLLGKGLDMLGLAESSASARHHDDMFQLGKCRPHLILVKRPNSLDEVCEVSRYALLIGSLAEQCKSNQARVRGVVKEHHLLLEVQVRRLRQHRDAQRTEEAACDEGALVGVEGAMQEGVNFLVRRVGPAEEQLRVGRQHAVGRVERQQCLQHVAASHGWLDEAKCQLTLRDELRGLSLAPRRRLDALGLSTLKVRLQHGSQFPKLRCWLQSRAGWQGVWAGH